MNKHEKYRTCKALAEKINRILELGLPVIDDDGEFVNANARFVFDDATGYIALEEGNSRSVFGDFEYWGGFKGVLV